MLPTKWLRRRRPASGRSAGKSGECAERHAEDYLIARGLRLRERNYRCKGGEIDLIMADGSTCVFVEVRYRKQQRFGSPAETVDWGKQSKLRRAAEHFLQASGLTDKLPCRFDVISIAGDRSIEWIKNAF
ncbi:YraN family protein [Proteobacteria bacterium 005FR1]|nr:YraN family protein [Proteobacteria bacterium 005FR1]